MCWSLELGNGDLMLEGESNCKDTKASVKVICTESHPTMSLMTYDNKTYLNSHTFMFSLLSILYY